MKKTATAIILGFLLCAGLLRLLFPATQKWEYRLVKYSSFVNQAVGPFRPYTQAEIEQLARRDQKTIDRDDQRSQQSWTNSLTASLNELGQDGWQFCGRLEPGGSNAQADLMVFRRPARWALFGSFSLGWLLGLLLVGCSSVWLLTQFRPKRGLAVE